MYSPQHFEETRTEILHALIAAHPLATLVTLTGHGLEGNAIPLLLRHDGSPFGTLVGHVARANPLWREFEPSVEALARVPGAERLHHARLVRDQA